jgi:hypothetical protein
VDFQVSMDKNNSPRRRLHEKFEIMDTHKTRLVGPRGTYTGLERTLTAPIGACMGSRRGAQDPSKCAQILQ